MATLFKFIFLFLLIVLITFQVVASSKKSYILFNSKSNSAKISSDLPAHKDLNGYLNSLERVVFFFLINRRYLNLNILFGLFLVNVNLRPFVEPDDLPVLVRSRLKYLLTQIDELQDERYNEDFLDKTSRIKISSLFTNDTVWSNRISKLELNSPKRIHWYRFPKWSKYLSSVDDIEKTIPHPKLSDLCLKSLALSDENLTNHSLRCKLPLECYKALIFGCDFGYGMTHRLLILLEARLSRGCFVFSLRIDELMRTSFCERAYAEAEFNANNGFRDVDLMFEQIALCTLDGHGKFLRKSWLSSLLKYQTSWGCFDEHLPSAPRKSSWTTSPDEDHCSGHVSAVAAATLASAIRFILENY